MPSVTDNTAVHTQGPWHIGEPVDVQHDYPERYVSGSVNVTSDEGATVATVYGGHKRPEWRPYVPLEQRDVNAHLIAAAPDMVQALREVAGDCYHIEVGDSVPTCIFCCADEGAPHEPECTMQFVLAAIARTDGRS